MISDVLSAAVDEIRRYQREFPAYDHDRERIDKVVKAMDDLRRYFDNPFTEESDHGPPQ